MQIFAAVVAFGTDVAFADDGIVGLNIVAVVQIPTVCTVQHVTLYRTHELLHYFLRNIVYCIPATCTFFYLKENI